MSQIKVFRIGVLRSWHKNGVYEMLKKSWNKAGAFTIGIVFFMGVLGCDQVSPSGGVVVDKPFPELMLTTLDGEAFKLDELKGQVVILKLWATWCVICREEEPYFKAFSKALSDEVVVASVAVDRDLNLVKEYLLDKPNNFVQLFDENMVQSKSVLNAHVIPQVYIINKSGILRYHVVGSIEWGESMLQVIERIKKS